MDAFIKDLLARADKQEEAAAQLFEHSFPMEKEKEQAVAIVAKVTANLYRVLGEFLAHQAGEATMSESDARRKALLDRSNAIRTAYAKAAASGDWSEFDRLHGGLGFGSGEGGGQGGT